MSRFSTRPWKLDRDCIRDSRGNIIAKLYHRDGESAAERKKSFRNGLVLSKAPELLAALNATTESLENWVELQDDEDARDYDAKALSTAHDLIDELEK